MLNAGIMTEEEFNEIIGSKEVCVFDFSATWCGPCKMMAPVLEDIADKYKGKYFFYQVDIDSAEDLANKFNVTAVPTIIVFKNGVEVARTMGYQDYETFDKFFNDSLNK